MQSANQRSQFLDYAKGVLIFLVVYGHTIQFIVYHSKYNGFWQDPIFKAIYIFHMPLFMAVSGFLAFSSIQKGAFFGVIKKRFWGLIVPIICWSVFHRTAFFVLGKGASIYSLPRDLLSDVFNSLWFLWALFGATTVVALTKQFESDRWHGLALISCAILIVPDVGILFLFKYTFPFFCIGYLIAQQKEVPILETLKKSKLLFAAALFLTILSYLLWKTETYIYISKMSLSLSNLWPIALRYSAGFIASIVIIQVIWRLYTLTFFRRLWCEIGKGSLYIYILSSYLFGFIERPPHAIANATNIFLHSIQELSFKFFLIAPMLAFLLSFCCLQIGNFSERYTLVSKFLFGRAQTSK